MFAVFAVLRKRIDAEAPAAMSHEWAAMKTVPRLATSGPM